MAGTRLSDGTASAAGPKGARGLTGPANVLTIGTVTADETPSATITGTTPSQVLNLVLAQGPKGDNGVSFHLLGNKNLISELPATGNTENDAYTVLEDGGHVYIWDDTNNIWIDGGQLMGPQGETGPTGPNGTPGVGISSITRTSGNGAAGTTDTYTIYYTDSTTTTFQVKNGTNGTNGAKGEKGDKGNTGNNGADGRTILNGTSTPSNNLGNVGDFYLRTSNSTLYGPKTSYNYNNNDENNYNNNVWGSPVSLIGPQGPAGSNGTNGRGISSITRTNGNGSAGSTDTYRITYTDSTTSTFTVVNGSNGTNGNNGSTGATGPAGDSITPRGNWSSNTNYAVNDLVYHAVSNASYVATQSGSAKIPSSSSSYWTVVANDGADGATGATGPQGPAGSSSPIWTFQSSAPTSPTSTGTKGWVAQDSTYMYVCIATNSWKRIAWSTWSTGGGG